MEYGLDNGAEEFVLYGVSCGAAVSWLPLVRSACRDSIVGMVMDSPVVAWQSTLNLQAAVLGVLSVRSDSPSPSRSRARRPPSVTVPLEVPGKLSGVRHGRDGLEVQPSLDS
jgi:hypothetical protein